MTIGAAGNVFIEGVNMFAQMATLVQTRGRKAKRTGYLNPLHPMKIHAGICSLSTMSRQSVMLDQRSFQNVSNKQTNENGSLVLRLVD